MLPARRIWKGHVSKDHFPQVALFPFVVQLGHDPITHRSLHVESENTVLNPFHSLFDRIEVRAAIFVQKALLVDLLLHRIR